MVFAIKIKLVHCILCGNYIMAHRFFRNSGYLIDFSGTVVTQLNIKFCRPLLDTFHPKEVLRNLKIPKFA